MREATQKWGRRLLWVLPICLALYCVGMLADFVWFRIRIPVGFQNANWSGNWKTERYGFLSGRLLVRLPDPLPANQEFKAEALVYYPIYSVWKTGRFTKMDFTAEFTPDGLSSSGQSKNTIPSGGGKMKFKAIAGGQVVDYVALIDQTRTQIVGGYLSTAPDDYGYFSIKFY